MRARLTSFLQIVFIAIGSLYLVAVNLPAQAPVTTVGVTGHLFSASGGTTTGLQLRFNLISCATGLPRIFGQGTILPTAKTMTPDSTGLITDTIWPNDVLNCGGITGNSRWTVTRIKDNVPQGPAVCFNVLAATGLNLDTATPCPQMSPATPPGTANDGTWNNGIFLGDLYVYGALHGTGGGASPFTSVADYGAKGDGLTDDTGSINSAVTYLETHGGGSLYFPPGTYRTSTGIRPSTSSSSCVNIYGSGVSNTIIRATAAMPGVYYRPWGANQSHCQVRDIAFDGNNLAKVAFWKAGQPSSWYVNIQATGAVPDTNLGSDATVLIGRNATTGPHGEVGDGHSGDDYETHMVNLQIYAAGAGSHGKYNLNIQQTTSDSSFDDVVAVGQGTIAGIYQWGGGSNTFSHAHCYPSEVNKHQPVCLWDAAGQSTFTGTEADGTTNVGIKFDAGGSTATGTSFVYGDPDHSDYSAIYGFSQTLALGRNYVFGAGCGGSTQPNWRLLAPDANSQAIIAIGPSACLYNSPVASYNLNSASTGSFATDYGVSGQPSQLVLQGTTDGLKQLLLGYNTSTNKGVIQALRQGTGLTPLDLNPNGGIVTANGRGIITHGTTTSGTCTVTKIVTLYTADGTAFTVPTC